MFVIHAIVLAMHYLPAKFEVYLQFSTHYEDKIRKALQHVQNGAVCLG